jgi:acetyltransferase-like isoleucine patch superfamily enzyme
VIKLRSGIAGTLLLAGHYIVRILKTWQSQGNAKLAKDVVIHHDGSVVNIAANPERIVVGANSQIRGELLVFAHGGKIEIGEWCYVGPGTTIWSSDQTGIQIGARVLISMGVVIHDTNSHPTNPEERFEQTKSIFTRGHPTDELSIKSSPIIIGDDVWIGFGAVIMKGVTIGHRAIIGARAIVRQDVPDDGFVGTPDTQKELK